MACPPLSHLEAFALRGINACWMPQHNAYSFKCRIERDGTTSNISEPGRDVFYTLNVLLGISRIPDRSQLSYSVEELFSHSLSRLPDLPSAPIYAYGMGLWAGAELNSEVSGRFVDRVQTLVDDESAWRRWTAQDLGLMLSGTSAQVQFDPKRWREPARRLHAYLVTNLGETGTGLFFNNAAGLRRRITSYATGVYCTLGCFHYGEALEYPPAIERAMRCVDALNFHQGPLGEWPWLYDAVRDVVVDHYPIYSVHQDGMAPAYLHHAVKHGGSIYREPIERGFAWIFGTNQMKHSMLESNKGLVVRGQCRREGLPRYRRAFRAVGNAWLGRRSDYVPPSKLELIPECRSYHLGWMLWSFGGRNDFPAITHAEPFRRSRDGQPASEQAS